VPAGTEPPVRPGVTISPVIRRIVASWTHATLWLGLLAAVVGTVVAVTAPRPATGWYAYAPLAHTAFAPGSINWQVVVGTVIALAGAVVAAFALGRLSALRRR
jgi:heme/copper-type cytochrome/quinol oxidase subunit 1